MTQEMAGVLLIDDLYAREEAKRRNILLISSLDIIEEAKNLRLINSGKEILDELIKSSFRISPKLYRIFLERIGEI